MGTILVLMLFLTALEYTSHNNNRAMNEEVFDDMSEDIEMLPAIDTKDMIATAPSLIPSISQKVKPVDSPTKLSPKIIASALDRLTDSQGSAPSTTDNEQTDEQAVSQVAVDNDDNPLNFRIVEQLPEFPGGMVAFVQWLTQNLNYPIIAQRQNIEGKVVISFIINKDGTIVDSKIAKSAHPLLDKEAMRLIRIMPKWKPGMQNNKPCRTMFAIPINFKL